MTAFDYPPTAEHRLGTALDDIETKLDDVKTRIEDLEATAEADDQEVDEQELAEARAEQAELENSREALSWAVHGDNRDGGFDGWGEDAVVELEAFTARTRARTVDHIRENTVGQFGSEEKRIWLLAASIQRAPWLDGGEDLTASQAITGELPPALQDWLDERMTELNDLSEGN